jgi:hypothetical protein
MVVILYPQFDTNLPTFTSVEWEPKLAYGPIPGPAHVRNPFIVRFGPEVQSSGREQAFAEFHLHWQLYAELSYEHYVYPETCMVSRM